MLASMDWPRLDTRAWNLTLGAAATSVLAACGPFVILDGETDSDAATDTDPPPNPTDPDATATDTDSPPPVECTQPGDCGPGFECIDNVCIPYDDYCDYGCCYDDCCYGECYYYECYSDEECGPQGLCESYYNGCVYPEPLLECDGGLDIVPIELVGGGPEEIVSLSFVDGNGDAAADLLVGRNGSAHVHLGPDGAFPQALPVPLGATVVDAVSGDLDGDGDADIVASTAQGSLLVLTRSGIGFELALDLFVSQPLHDLTVLQWNGDGTLDVAGVTEQGQAVLHLGDGNGGFVANAALPSFGLVRSLARTDYGGDEYGDLVLQDDVETAQAFFGDPGGDLNVDLYLPGSLHGERRVLAGAINPGTPHEVVGYTPKSEWVLLELWNEGIDGPATYALTSDGTWADVGDLDGNGTADVVVGGGSSLQYVYSSGDSGFAWLSCQSTFFLGGQVSVLATGDFDGNGRADVALDNSGIVTVLLSI